MLVFVFAGLGLAGLSAGGVLASIVVGISIIVTTGFAIVAFVGRDQLRSFAIGFLIPVIGYAATVLAIGASELHPYQGRLPTTKLFGRVFRLVVKQQYVNLETGETVTDYDPTAVQLGTGPTIVPSETPERTTFMSLAHVLTALMFGYVGAKFAVWIYRRQLPGAES